MWGWSDHRKQRSLRKLTVRQKKTHISGNNIPPSIWTRTLFPPASCQATWGVGGEPNSTALDAILCNFRSLLHPQLNGIVCSKTLQISLSKQSAESKIPNESTKWSETNTSIWCLYVKTMLMHMRWRCFIWRIPHTAYSNTPPYSLTSSSLLGLSAQYLASHISSPKFPPADHIKKTWLPIHSRVQIHQVSAIFW